MDRGRGRPLRDDAERVPVGGQSAPAAASRDPGPKQAQLSDSGPGGKSHGILRLSLLQGCVTATTQRSSSEPRLT